MTTATDVETATHYLDKEEELRVEVKLGTTVTLTLTDGTAEIFGAELPKSTPTELPGGKYAVYSWHGATLQIIGETEHAYTARDTPMVTYLNVDGVLEVREKGKSFSWKN